MILRSIFKMSIHSIMSNKIRTFLTMLGIIIGVFSVIVLISIGQGATASVMDTISSMGSNIISINISDRRSSFDYKDLIELENLEGVKSATPIYNIYGAVSHDLKSEKVRVVGANENYFNINNYELEYGRLISPIDVDYRNKVAVMGLTTVNNLFGYDDPIDNEILIDGQKYTVVGVLKPKGSSIIGDYDDIVIIPISNIMRQKRTAVIHEITAQAESADTARQAAENIESYLYDYLGNDESYTVFSQGQILDIMDDITGMLTAMLAGIAGISLLVGGIGIMNIMLVTVSERTREIGIRKALGAGRGSIMLQFLIESSIISGIGGIIGVLSGIYASSYISKLLGTRLVINMYVLTVAFGFSLLIGLFFGLYPANKASKLRPIDALRFE